MTDTTETISDKFNRDLIAQDITLAILNAEPPTELFHYTNPAALVSIAQTHELWASRVGYLNDASEHTIAYSTISDVIKEELARNRDDSDVKYLEELADMARACSSGGFTFVVSFSEVGDLLSHWRAYVPQGGYSLGFDTAKLKSVVEPQGWSLLRCVYDADEQRALTRLVVARLLHWYRVHVDVQDSSHDDLVSWGRANIGLWMWAVSSTFKHASYAEEREWRLVNFSLNNAMTTRPRLCQKFRAGKGIIIPYVTVNVAAPDGGICVSLIIVSPGPYQELAGQSACDLLLNLSGGPIETRYAKAPHRSL